MLTHIIRMRLVEITRKLKKVRIFLKIKKKKGFVYTLKQNKVAYAYIAPFYILFAIFGLFPIVAGFGLSFLRWDGIGPMHFNGVTNYINLFKDPLFWKALSNTLLIGIIAHIPIPVSYTHLRAHET